jgi:probable HAF family extracellular repeat protein
MKPYKGLLLLYLSAFSVNGSELIELGDLSGGIYSSEATSTNLDGSVVVGASAAALGTEAFSWTQLTGITSLGDLAGGIVYSFARGVSTDGLVIVGISHSGSGYQAFKWESGTGMVGIGDLPGGIFYSDAKATNNDGSVIVGTSNSALGYEAFRWTSATGIVGLGDFAGGIYSSQAVAVNSDGSVVAGFGTNALGTEAFKWTSATGLVGLGDLTGGTYLSVATAISSDGSVIAGYSEGTLGREAFKWTSTTGMVGLGDLEGGIYQSLARGISADGHVIVGTANNSLGTEAFIWTEHTGMVSLSKWLINEEGGIPGWTNTEASAISADGYVVVGHGTNASGKAAFIAKLKSGFISIDDYNSTLNSLSNINYFSSYKAKNIIQSKKKYNKTTFWIKSNRSDTKNAQINNNATTKEVGFTYKKNGNLFYTFYTGTTSDSSTLSYDGKFKSKANYLGFDIHFQAIPTFPLWITASFLNTSNEININRAYENLGVVEGSVSNTQQNIKSYNVKAQVRNIVATKTNIQVNPFVNYNRTEIKTDGFSESEGGFPATFNASKTSQEELSLGVGFQYNINKNNTVFSSIEKVSNIGDSSNNMEGEVIDLYDFKFNNRLDNTWLKAHLGFSYTSKKHQFTFDVNSSSYGDKINTNYGLKYSFSF